MDINKVETFFPRLNKIITTLRKENKLLTPIKNGGWTPVQIINHLVDSQTQAYYRTMWILSEDMTTLKPFNQDKWVELSKDFPLDAALHIINGLYTRWFHLLKNINPKDYQKIAIHPEIGEVILGPLVEYYINHGESHLETLIK